MEQEQRQPDERRGRLTTAFVLIAIGVILLIAQLTGQWE